MAGSRARPGVGLRQPHALLPATVTQELSGAVRMQREPALPGLAVWLQRIKGTIAIMMYLTLNVFQKWRRQSPCKQGKVSPQKGRGFFQNSASGTSAHPHYSPLSFSFSRGYTSTVREAVVPPLVGSLRLLCIRSVKKKPFPSRWVPGERLPLAEPHRRGEAPPCGSGHEAGALPSPSL